MVVFFSSYITNNNAGCVWWCGGLSVGSTFVWCSWLSDSIKSVIVAAILNVVICGKEGVVYWWWWW